MLMSVNVKIIKHLILLSFVFMAATYAVFLNMEGGYIILQSKWVSNNLLFAIFSGVFASILVVVLNETRQYLINKRSTQDILFSQFATLYSQLLIMQNNMRKSIEQHDEIITDTLLEQSSSISKMCIENISNVDYATFCPQNKIQKMIQRFRLVHKSEFILYLNNCGYLKIAIVEDQMLNIKTFGHQETITSQSLNTGKTVIKLQKGIVPLLLVVNQYLELLDNSVSNRYKWVSVRDNMQAYHNNYTFISLKDFLSKEDEP